MGSVAETSIQRIVCVCLLNFMIEGKLIEISYG